jgi:hypothetical protein
MRDVPALLGHRHGSPRSPALPGHERHRLPVAAVDVLREYVEYRAEDGRSSLDPPNKRAEVL